jgi:WD40 repeat protein
MRQILLPLLLVLLPLAPAAAQESEPPARPPTDEIDTGKLEMAFNTPGHVGRIRHMVFTPDSKTLISVGMDRTAQLWDVKTGRRLRVLRLPAVPTAVALAPDGKTLLVGGFGFWSERGKPPLDRVFLLNLEDSRLVSLLGSAGDVRAVAFAADGDRAFADEGGTCSLWTGLKNVWSRKPLPTGIQAVARFGAGHSLAPIISPQPGGTRLAMRTSDFKAFGIWDLAEPGKPVQRATQKFDKAVVKALAFSPDGRRLATGHDDGGNRIRLWSPDGAALQTIRVEDVSGDKRYAIRQILFRNNNEVLVFGMKRSQQLVLSLHLGTSSVQEVCRLENAGGELIIYGALSPDGQQGAFMTGPAGSQLALFPLSGKVSVRILPRLSSEQNRFSPAHLGWTPKGYTIAWNASSLTQPDQGFDLQKLQVPDAIDVKTLVRAVTKRDGWEIKPTEGPDGRLQISRQGKLVAEAQGKTADLVGSILGATLPNRGEVSWAAWIQGFTLFGTDTATGKQLRSFWSKAPVRAIATSPDGKYLLASDIDQTFYIYRPDQRDPLLQMFTSGPHWVVWVPRKGYYAASTGGERLMGWTVNNGPNQLATFYPAQRFRKVLYRPDVIRLVLEKGSVAAALKEANARAGITVQKPAEVEELLPPRARLEKLAEIPTKVGTKVTVQVKAEAAVKSQPVKALRLLLDGRPFPEGRFTLEVKPGTRPEATWQVEVPPGKHELKVLVRGKDTADVSNAVTVKTDVPEDQKPTLYCLPVGINYNWGGKVEGLKLNAAENDARNMLKALKDNCTGTGNQFRTVVGEALLGEKASKKAILTGLQGIRQKGAKPGDLVVLFFACHGVAEKGGFFLLGADVDPADIPTTGLSGTALREALKEMPCQVLLIFDACQSGSVLARFTRATDELGRSLSDDEAAVTVLTAAMAHETAIEKGGNGLLTQALQEALARGFFDAEEGVMHVHHVYSKVIDRVLKESSGKQHPLLLTPWTMPPLVLRKVQGTGE